MSPTVGRFACVADLLALSTAAALLWSANGSVWPLAYAASALATLEAIAPRRGRLEASLTDEVGWILQRMALPLLVLVPLAREESATLAVPVVVATGSVLTTRFVAYAVLRWLRTRGIVVEPCVILGAGPLGRRLATVLLEHPEFGLAPMGFLDAAFRPDLPLPLLGRCMDLGTVAEELGVRTILVAQGDLPDEEVVRSIRAAGRGGLDLYVAPRLAEAGAVPRGSQRLWGIHLVHAERAIFSPASRALKRGFDLVVASLGLVVLSPVLVMAAIAIKVSGRGPVFFRQRRIGVGGVPFEMLKFRTMETSDDSDTTWSVAQDHRVTAVGRILRRTSVDELPQLVNVLRGNMSIVGPRPERPHFVEEFAASVPGYEDRHRVAGGMTGLAQVHGRSRSFDSIPERARLDNDYIDNWSFWGDLAISARTARLLFQGDGDREPGEPLPPVAPIVTVPDLPEADPVSAREVS